MIYRNSISDDLIMTSQILYHLLVMFQVHAKFQVRMKFASMCLFVDNLSGEEEGEEKKTEQKQ